jgi:predicted GNAT family N-acyltransferase
MESAPAEPKTSSFQVFEAKTAEQIALVYQQRYEVFTAEQHKYQRSADHKNRVLVDTMDQVATHLCVAHEGRIVGSLRQVRGKRYASEAMVRDFSLDRFLPFGDTQMSFSGRLFILPEYRGSKALFRLLLDIYRSGRTAGILLDFINCNPHLVRFYEMLGYRRYRPYFEHPELGFQIPLVLICDDAEYFRRIKSPFALVSDRYKNNPLHAEWFGTEFPKYRSFLTSVNMPAEEFCTFLGQKLHNNDVPAFKGLSESQVTELLSFASHLHIDQGTHIVRRGDLGEELYVILDGIAEVSVEESGNRRLLATLGRGDVFGEISVITARPRSADVRTRTPLEVLYIDRATLLKLVKTKPAIAAPLLLNLATILAERLLTIDGSGTFHMEPRDRQALGTMQIVH